MIFLFLERDFSPVPRLESLVGCIACNISAHHHMPKAFLRPLLGGQNVWPFVFHGPNAQRRPSLAYPASPTFSQLSRVGMSSNPVLTSRLFPHPKTKWMVITRVGLVTSKKNKNKNYLKIICFVFAATRPRDAGTCRHASICLRMVHMVSLQWRGVAVLNLYCLKWAYPNFSSKLLAPWIKRQVPRRKNRRRVAECKSRSCKKACNTYPREKGPPSRCRISAKKKHSSWSSC